MTEQPIVQFVFNADLLRIVDGDTLEVMVDRGFYDSTKMMVRLYGCDCPEARGVERLAGEWVGNQVAAFIGDSKRVVLHSVKCKASFSRFLFNVWVEGRNLSEWLVERGYAWPTDGDGKIVGIRDINRLHLPEGIKQSVREAMS